MSGFFKRCEKLISRGKKVSKEKGICYVIYAGTERIFNQLTAPFWVCYYRVLKSRTFLFDGKRYSYFYHGYNRTWRSERAIEVPILWDMVKKCSGKKILEVGNVLSHYFAVDHDILDEYEEADDVINQDIVDFQPSKKYDLIVSISTLEHVGWDEEGWSGNRCCRDPMKVLKAIENLRRCLVTRGEIVVTFPIGYNPEMDKLLNDGRIQFTMMHCMKKISADNTWIEVNWKDIKDAKYDYPFPCANGLIIGIIEGQTICSAPEAS